MNLDNTKQKIIFTVTVAISLFLIVSLLISLQRCAQWVYGIECYVGVTKKFSNPTLPLSVLLISYTLVEVFVIVAGGLLMVLTGSGKAGRKKPKDSP